MRMTHPVISNDIYIQHIKENPFIAINSKTTYVTNIKAVLNRTGAKTIHELLTQPKQYGSKVVHLEDPTSYNSQYSHMIAILAFLKYSGLKTKDHQLFVDWYQDFTRIREKIKHIEDNNIASAKQERTHIDWSDVIKVRDRLPYGSREHVLLSMYTYVPPRRQLDYTQLRVYTNPKYTPQLDHNHFHTYSIKYKTPYMFIKEFKNAKYFKSFFNKEIPKELVKIISHSLETEPREYIFTTAKGAPFATANAFQKYSNQVLKSVFDNPEFSVNALRHSYSTHTNKQSITVGERQRIAIKMGHSLKKNLEYAFMQQDPPLSLVKSKPPSQQTSSPLQEECYKKNKTTRKIEKIPCPKSK
jgi:hypothetical protein